MLNQKKFSFVFYSKIYVLRLYKASSKQIFTVPVEKQINQKAITPKQDNSSVFSYFRRYFWYSQSRN